MNPLLAHELPVERSHESFPRIHAGTSIRAVVEFR
jgi:Zn-dependent alcohol dehydrogenase